MSQELKQRTNAIPTPEKGMDSFSGKKNLAALQPDYAIKVFYKYDPKTKTSDAESEANLKVLSSILQLNGFIVNVRPDTNTNYLILFVTLNDSTFEKLVKLSNQIDSLFNVKANPTSDEKISIAERMRLVNLKLTLPKTKGASELHVAKGNVVSIMPVKHIMKLEKEYTTNWKNLGKLFKSSSRTHDINFLKQNLGTKYALYYRFVQAYVSSVGCITIFGLLAWYFLGNFSILYAVINTFIGFTCYLCIYAADKKARREWNLENISKTQTIAMEESDIIPDWKVLVRKILYIPVTLSGALGLFSAQFACFLLEIFINEIYQGPYKSILALVPTALVCIVVPVGTAIYGVISQKYVQFEKNPTKEAATGSLLIKMFLFNCLASYSPLLITSFIYLPLGYMLDPYLQTIQAMLTRASTVYTYLPKIPTLESQYKVNNSRISSQIFYFMVINQVIGTLVEFVLPTVLAKVMSVPMIAGLLGTKASAKTLDMKALDDPEEHAYLEIVRADFQKPEVSIDDDYRQHVLQYGFLMLFGPVWTLGALSCFIFGVIQQEGDYIKYLKVAKPAVGERSESSQPWILFMRYLLIIGSFVSMAITLMYNNRHQDTKEEILSFVGQTSVEHPWFLVVGGAFISCISVQILVSCSELVIDYKYTVDEKAEFEREQKASGLISSLAKRDETTPNTSAGNVLEEANTFQASY